MSTDDIALDGDTTAVGDASPSGTPTLAEHGERLVLAQGDRVGRYVILGRLGVGGMGTVYSAFDPRLDRRVALKLMHRVGGQRDETAVFDEAQAMARLSHRNVVAVHDVGEHQGRVFLAMEFLEGSTLARWLSDGHRGWREILGVFRQAGAGLAAAHDKRIVHRDFKPQNVMVGADGRVAVTDFGLARRSMSHDGQAPARQRQRSSRRVAFEGTPAYSAPEQHRDEEVGAAADQFSFCVALYRALYRQHPFEGESPAELAYHITHGEVRSAPPGSDVPAWFRQAIVRGLARDPEDRHASMHSLLDALGRDPTRRRRWLVGGVALLAVAPASMLVDHVASARVAAECTDAVAVIDGVWGEERRNLVRAAMLSSEAVDAEGTFERTVVVIDDYVRRWRDERGAACRLAAQASADPIHEATRECLEERRMELDALLEVYEDSAPQTMRSALVAASALTDPAHCTERRWLARNPARERSLDGEVAELRREVLQAIALYNAGDYEKSVEVATSVARRAKARNLRGLAAEAEARWANALNQLGAYEEAEDIAEAAFYEAVEAGADVAAVRLTGILAYGTGYAQRRHRDGERWARLGIALHAREAMPAPELALLYHIRATVLQSKGDIDGAIADNQAALGLRREVLGEHHPALVDSLINLSNVLIQANDPAAARAFIEEATSIAKLSYGPQHPRLSSLAELEGNVESLTGNSRTALPHYRRALEIRRLAFGDSHPAVITSRWNLAASMRKIGDIEGADEQHREALRSLEEAGRDDTAFALRHLVRRGRLALEREDVRSAMAVYERGREQLASLRQEGKETADAQYELGQLAARVAGPDAAIELFSDSLETLRAAGGGSTSGAAVALMEIANRELNRGRPGPARARMDDALEILANKPATTSALRVAIPLNEARIHIATGQIAAAEESLRKVRSALTAADDPDARLHFHLARAEIAFERADAETARPEVEHAAQACSESDAPAECRTEVAFGRARLRWAAGEREQAVAAVEAIQAKFDATIWGDGWLRQRVDRWLQRHVVP